MRTVYIDLSKDEACRRDRINVGFTGEHNATELVIAVPQAMADESDYMVAVFLADGKIVRSERITETAENEKPYVEDNQIHILLSRRLTRHTTLGLQIEGYRKNDKGVSVLLGKTQFISNLEFSLSPEGESDCTGLVDPEELYDLMDWWKNREDEEQPDEDLSDMIDWWKNRTDDDASGIIKYERCEDLPRDAEDGDLAYVMNDSGDMLIGPIEFDTYYAALHFKEDMDRDILQSLPSMGYEESDLPFTRYVGIDFRTDKYENLCFFIMIYYPPVGSIFVFSEFACEEDLVEYMLPGKRSVPGYVYCCGEGDVSALFEGENIDPASTYLTRGWYKLTYDNSEYFIYNTHIEEQERVILEPIERCDITAMDTLRNCFLKLDDSDFNQYTNDILPVISECFDVYAHEYRQKGLYLVEEDHWRRQKILPLITAADRTRLPLTAEDGQFAIVRENTWLVESHRGYMYVGNIIDRVYINPVLCNDAWLTDCRISAKIITINYQNYTVEFLENGAGLDLESNAKDGRVFLSLNTNPWNNDRQHFLYARENGPVNIPANSLFGNSDAVTLYVPKGWSRVYVYAEGCDAWQIDPYTELPNVIFSNYGSQYQLEITEYESEIHEEPFITNTPFCEQDDGKGVWYFGGGRWRKLDA